MGGKFSFDGVMIQRSLRKVITIPPWEVKSDGLQDRKARPLVGEVDDQEFKVKLMSLVL